MASIETRGKEVYNGNSLELFLIPIVISAFVQIFFLTGCGVVEPMGRPPQFEKKEGLDEEIDPMLPIRKSFGLRALVVPQSGIATSVDTVLDRYEVSKSESSEFSEMKPRERIEKNEVFLLFVDPLPVFNEPVYLLWPEDSLTSPLASIHGTHRWMDGKNHWKDSLQSLSIYRDLKTGLRLVDLSTYFRTLTSSGLHQNGYFSFAQEIRLFVQLRDGKNVDVIIHFRIY